MMISEIQEKATSIASAVRKDGIYEGEKDPQQTTLVRYLYQLGKFTIKNLPDGRFRVTARNESIFFAKRIYSPSGTYRLPEDVDAIIVLAYIRRTFKGHKFEWDTNERKITFLTQDGFLKDKIDRIDSIQRLESLKNYIINKIAELS